MGALLDASRHRRLKRVEGLVLHNNDKVLRFVKRLGFEAWANPEDPSLKIVSGNL